MIDNLAFIVGIGLALLMGWLLTSGWIAAIVIFVSVSAILLKDFAIYDAADWRDILPGFIGLGSAQIVALLARQDIVVKQDE